MEFRPAVIHGKMIELEVDPGLPEGQRVEVVILPVPRQPEPGEGILRTAGSMADEPEFEAIMAEVERERRTASSRASAE
jgi:hypothetical protein